MQLLKLHQSASDASVCDSDGSRRRAGLNKPGENLCLIRFGRPSPVSLIFNQDKQNAQLYLPSDQDGASPNWYGYLLLASGEKPSTMELTSIWQGGAYSGGILL